MNKVPQKLTKDPIVEAAFEIRFDTQARSASDLIPGLLYPRFKGRFGNPERLPMADFPIQLQQFDKNLRYSPRLQLRGEQLSIYIGDYSAIISCPKPYIGWTSFFPLINEVIASLQVTDLVTNVERVSLKYINLLEGNAPADQFKLIRFSAELGNHQLTDWLSSAKTEFIEDGLTVIAEVQSGATVTIPRAGRRDSFSGMVISLDTIAKAPVDFWNSKENVIEKAHSVGKQVFFGMLTEQTLTSYGPIWN